MQVILVNIIDKDDCTQTTYVSNVVSYNENKATRFKVMNAIQDVYNAWNHFWNGGELYDSYEDFAEEWNDNDLLRDNFEVFKKCSTSFTGQCLIDIVNGIYPDYELEIIPSYSIDLYY